MGSASSGRFSRHAITGRQIKAARALAGISQEVLADACHITACTVSGAERGKNVSDTIRFRLITELERCGIRFTRHGVEVEHG